MFRQPSQKKLSRPPACAKTFFGLAHPQLSLALLILVGLAAAAPAQGFWLFSPDESEKTATQTVEDQHRANQEASQFFNQTEELTKQLLTHLADPNPDYGSLADGLAVCSFVELKKLTRTSSLGRSLAEQLMTRLQQHGFTVTEIRQTNDILIQEQRGEYGLSRDPASIRANVSSAATLTGTYTLSEYHVFINARIIDARTGNLLSSASATLPRNRLTNSLLADRVSAETGEPGEIFMKKLEL